MSRTHCICGAVFQLKPFSENFDALRCLACRSHHFVAKAGTNASDFQYDGDTEKYAETSYLFGNTLRWSHEVLLKRAWEGRKVLEIGCFNGFFLAELKKVGAEVYGFDINSAALTVGKKVFGLEHLYGSIETLASLGPYDDIVCIDVIEHLDAPEVLLSRLEPMLNPFGLLHIAGPTLERRLHDKSDYPPHHKWWFSRDGLTSCLLQSGYDVDQMVIQRDALLLLRNYIGKVLNKSQPPNEFHGRVTAFAPSADGALTSRIYKAATWAGIALFGLLGISYCSTLIIAKRSER